MSADERLKEQLSETHAELRALPTTWTFTITKENNRVLYQKKSEREQTYVHPTLGALPKPWILRMQIDKTTRAPSVAYYNRDTKRTSTRDPRYMKEYLDNQSKSVIRSLSIAANVVLNSRKFDITTYARSPIKSHDIRNQFMIVHTIDSGGGEIGGMNGGVFVVRMHGNPSRMFVEKRFKGEDIEIAKEEIRMLHKVKHSSLTFYIDAFITTTAPLTASVYCEFCDRGSLQDIMRVYTKQTEGGNRVTVPEAFVWHAFVGLCDGLAYLQGGVSFIYNKQAKRDPNWIPILHRDIKPDNVLLRSRSTLGSKKYFYCVLSDFGLACEDYPDGDPNANDYQTEGYKLGTSMYWAPELLYDPFPVTRQSIRGPDKSEIKKFPPGSKHTARSDIWALGATIYNLCVCDGAHINMSQYTPQIGDSEFYAGTISRHRDLVIPEPYSRQLCKAIRTASAWNMRDRLGPISMVVELERLLAESGFNQQGDNDPLPGWATRVHEYQFSAEKVEKEEASKGSRHR